MAHAELRAPAVEGARETFVAAGAGQRSAGEAQVAAASTRIGVLRTDYRGPAWNEGELILDIGLDIACRRVELVGAGAARAADVCPAVVVGVATRARHARDQVVRPAGQRTVGHHAQFSAEVLAALVEHLEDRVEQVLVDVVGRQFDPQAVTGQPHGAVRHAPQVDVALLVAGEKGIGKTAALTRLEKFIRKEKPDLLVHRLTIPPKTTSREAVYNLIGELIGTDVSAGPSELARTDAERTPTIIMLDEAQNLFLAEVGHLDGWRALLNLTNVRVENLFWIVSINNQSWAYLCNVFGREYQMRNAIRVKRWSQNEIRSLILSRNHLSGFKLQYDDILLTSRGPEAGNLRNAEQRFFSLLWDGCRGIPMTALEMWLTSIRPHGRTVTVGLPQIPGSGILEKLGSKLMFVYAAVVTHENLTFDEILKVTNQQENVVRYALKSALDAEFMERSNDGRYRITPLWYNTVISYLTRKNMLHE